MAQVPTRPTVDPVAAAAKAKVTYDGEAKFAAHRGHQPYLCREHSREGAQGRRRLLPVSGRRLVHQPEPERAVGSREIGSGRDLLHPSECSGLQRHVREPGHRGRRYASRRATQRATQAPWSWAPPSDSRSFTAPAGIIRRTSDITRAGVIRITRITTRGLMLTARRATTTRLRALTASHRRSGDRTEARPAPRDTTRTPGPTRGRDRLPRRMAAHRRAARTTRTREPRDSPARARTAIRSGAVRSFRKAARAR